jgi:ATP-dependent helicase YprA (DUF1998 family)
MEPTLDNNPITDSDTKAAKKRERMRAWRDANPDKMASYVAKYRDKRIAGHRKWREKNTERVKAYRAAYYVANKEKSLAASKEWQAKNHTQYVEKQKIWAAQNRGKRTEVIAAYRDKNRARIKAVAKAWAQANPEIRRMHESRRRARKAESIGTYTTDDVQQIYKAQRGRCAFCRSKLGQSYEIDHIKALARGGSNDRRNIHITCLPCNRRKHAKDAIEFAQLQGLLL